MPDISMCKGLTEERVCPMREKCYRYTAKPTPYYQAWFVTAPVKFIHGSASCEGFLPESNYRPTSNIGLNKFSRKLDV